MTETKLYWVATTGEYGSNKCIHIDLNSWTEKQWDQFHYWIPEQERYAFINRWATNSTEPDWADPYKLLKAAIAYLAHEAANITEPDNEPATFGMDVAVQLLQAWMETIKAKQPQPLVPYHYDPHDDECEVLTFEDIDKAEAEQQ
jgi:hypothetical protein